MKGIKSRGKAITMKDNYHLKKNRIILILATKEWSNNSCIMNIKAGLRDLPCSRKYNLLYLTCHRTALTGLVYPISINQKESVSQLYHIGIIRLPAWFLLFTHT